MGFMELASFIKRMVITNQLLYGLNRVIEFKIINYEAILVNGLFCKYKRMDSISHLCPYSRVDLQ